MRSSIYGCLFFLFVTANQFAFGQGCASQSPTVMNGSRCGTGTVSLSASNSTAGVFRWYAALTGGTILRTSGSVTTDNYTTTSISVTTTYFVTFHNGTCESTPRKAVVATVNALPSAPTVTNGSRCASGTVLLSASSPTAGTFRWYSTLTGGVPFRTSLAGLTADSYTTISIPTTTTYYVTFHNGTCETSPRTAITATINAIPSTPVTVGGSRCGAGTVLLASNSPTAGTFVWYSASTGGAVVQTSTSGLTTNTYTTQSINTTTNYYVSLRSAANCESTRGLITATINAVPAAPTVTTSSTCGPGMVTLAANSPVSGTFKWYSAASGGVPLQTSAAAQTTNNYTTPSLSTTTTYYVSFTNASNCESTRTAVIATVNANNPANAPTITNRSRCGTGAISLSATSTSSGTFRWYNALVGGVLLRTSSVATTDNYTIQSLSTTTTYYVTFHNGTCESAPRRAVTATINPIVMPTVVPAARCGPGTISLTANSSSAGVFRWYTALTGGTASQVSQAGQTTNKYVIPSLSATTTYYVTFHNGVCESTPRTPIVATINPVAIAPTATATDGLCGTSGSVPLSATSGTPGVFKWYAEEAGGTAVQTSPAGQTANSYTTPEIATSTSFYVTFTNSSGCESTPRTQIVAPVMPSVKQLVESDSLREVFIPQAVRVSRSGKIATEIHESHTLSEIHENDAIPLFGALSCTGGSYYVGFQLYYDAGGLTTTEWAAELTVSLQKGSEKLWTTPLLVTSKNQIFIATNFYNLPIICSADYSLKIEKKHTCQAPLSNISIRALFFKDQKDLFDVNSPLELNCSHSEEVTTLTIVSDVNAATEYDVEWVFIAEHEKYDPALHGSPFSFKEPVRVTVPKFPYLHRVFYQTGKIWYRSRPVGYHLQYPDHRMVGNWVNGNCSPLAILNPEDQKNWQVQTVFAEEGKNKKVVQYFDGTLRSRQTQTNLSSEDVTLVGETLYDYEGRKSVEVLAAPEASYTASLRFKSGINEFAPLDQLVSDNTDDVVRKKFNYDNQRIENSPLALTNGAGRYYSDQNNPPPNALLTHSVLIPNGEGYVYSQTEYLNDGTGRVSRQSGVGKEFKMDGNRATRNYYGEAASVELMRLFGSNVGNASHYKKNLVVDANGQVSVSYHDQSDRVIASALAGEKPDNVDPLPSFTGLDVSQISVDISDKNRIIDGVSITSHKLMNTSPATGYALRYELSSLRAQIEEVCLACSFELSIMITDPDGELIDLGNIAGNEAPDTYSYVKRNITAESCSTASSQVVEINLLGGGLPNGPVLTKIGDYTIVKKLAVADLSFEDVKAVVKSKPSVQAKMQILRDSYVPDPTQCEVCQTGDCTDTEKNISDAINKIANLDCENIKNKIIEKLINDRNDPNYTPTQAEIESDADFCRYRLCVQDKASDVFEKQLALAPNWTAAVQKGYNTAVDKDPFFNEKGVSGYGYKNKVIDRLNNVVVSEVNANLRTPRPILEVLNPNNPLYYIDDQGKATNSTSNGYHVLYYELMKQNPADYATQLDNQRWSLYKWLYLEAKRKTKLSMPAYSTDCPKAKEELERTDKIPTTEGGVNNWAEAKDFTAVTDEQVNMMFYLIKISCNPSSPLKISLADSTETKRLLRVYFERKDVNNFYRLILKNHLELDNSNQITDPSLRAISVILSKYGGCESALSKVAVDDPLVCRGYKTINFPIPTQLPNLVVNPAVTPTPDCTPFITNNGCYNGWSAQSGAPEVPYPGQNIIRLSAQQCNVTSSAVGGSIVKELVPGKKYRFSVTYRSPFTNQIDNLYCQLFSQGGYTRTDGSKFVLGMPSTPCSPFSTSTNQATGGENLAIVPPTCSSCMEPGATYPDDINVNGQDTKKLWMKQNVVNTNSWTTDEVIFTANQKSTSFVFSTIPNVTATDITGDFTPSNLTTWGTNGTFENSSDPSIPQMFFGTNTTGIIDPSAALNNENLGLLIRNIAGPESKGGVLLKFNAINSSAPVITISASIRAPFSNSMSNNPNAKLFIGFPNVDWEILDRNELTFDQAKNLGRSLKLKIARKPGVGIVPLPDYFTISTTMKDSEANTTGVLMVDQILVMGDAFFGERDFGGPKKSIEIRDVTIKEYFEPTRTFCVDYGTTSVPDYIAQYKATCMANEVDRKKLLAQIAIDNYLEEEVTKFSTEYRAQCLDGAQETFKYAYTPKEYHYTLYYYDQAGNLAQTVPPEGVMPVPMDRLGIDNPQHKLITRYQYNSLNQLLNQTTPDAGKSDFWYNDKSQLRLSQNAQQRIDNKYSYTKYDEQGRITEVGEMYSTEPSLTFVSKVEDPEFPIASDTQVPGPNTYLLTDVTRTHYDFANTTPQWTNLVNVTVKGNTLTNTGGGYWQDHAFSVNAIPANQDGYIEFRLRSGDVEVGLSSAPQSTIYTVDFGIMLQYNAIYLTQNSNANTVIGSYGPTDLIRIERVGTTVFYKKNGSIFYTSAIPSTTALYGHVHMNTLGSVITDIAMGILPSPNSYASGNQDTFIQQNLRNRVSWVEVIDKSSAETPPISSGEETGVRSYYSYDIHGNVKSLVQQIPDLPNKRTDYVYDLVSGKVDFVMYQYGEKDQFIHRYEYDPDNRITIVKTSSDGFIWDNDAEYQYYLHGPLARTMLGQHTLQGLDYYYTLQGWLKGVNSPTGASAQANDPGGDGHGTSKFAKDVIAFNLGYYQGDYKPIGGGLTTLIENSSPLLWRGAGGEALDLYNGNIAWMATDLSAIASAKADRNKGVQAMQYNYDQLHRIVRSRSRTFSGVIDPRTGSPAPYDENYTYDANGNILTLLRNNELGAVRDNFTYQYYTGTNRLRGVKPITDNVTYRAAVTSNTKVYSNITVTDDAYVPDGADVTLRATENIYLHPRFRTAGGRSFRAYITDEGNYQYDAIGNLIVDNAEGTKISWTPYGKVRQVKTKGDSVTVSYRYDASGNRVEKRVTTLTDAGNTTVKATNYVRDASGNVMAIYQSPLSGGEGTGLPAGQAGLRLIEQPIYGSSRLGMYTGGRKEGQRRLGQKNYELSNHLGNVLTVITDNINMSITDGVTATVVSATDYYPFGLAMGGRAFSDDSYRYGFNGKEKDNEISGNGNAYDFGERSYDPRIGRFKSIDPYAQLFAANSPYSYGFNSPIYLIDADGMYPKPSKLLADVGIELPPLAAGLLDGAFEGSPLGLVGLAVDLTDGQFRSDMANAFTAIANDPVGTLGAIFSEYKDVIERTLSGKATAEDQYFLGNEIGALVSGALTGGAIKKVFSKIEIFQKGKLANKVELELPPRKKGQMPAWVKEGKDFEKAYFDKLTEEGKKVTTQVSFTAVDPKTGKTVRAVVDGIVENADATKTFIETKLNKTTELTKKQEIVYKALSEGKATAVGQKAKEAGFKVGEKVQAVVIIETKY